MRMLASKSSVHLVEGVALSRGAAHLLLGEANVSDVTEVRMPGGPIASRPLHFVWIADCSGSMSTDGKIQTLNIAVREALPAMVAAADENPEVQVLTHVLAFSTGAHWLTPQPIPVESFSWVDLSAEGVTDLGKALSLVADEFSVSKMPTRAVPPVVVLLSDGQPTDDWKKGLARFMSEPWGQKAVRIAIAIGRDADKDVLREFIGHGEIPVLEACNPDALTHYIRWVSTAVVSTVSSPASQQATMLASDKSDANVHVAPPVEQDFGPSVW